MTISIRNVALACAALAPLGSLRAGTYTNIAYNPSGGSTWNAAAYWSSNPDPVTPGNDYVVNPDPVRIGADNPIGTYFTTQVGETTTAWRYFSFVRDFGTGTPTGGDTFTFQGNKLILADKASFRGFGRNTTSVANWEMQDGGMMVLNAGGSGTTTAWDGNITTSGSTALGLITNSTTTLTVDATIAGTGTLHVVQSGGAVANLNFAGDISQFSGTLLLSSSTTKNTNTATFSIANSAPSATLQLNWESPLFRYDLASNNVSFASLVLGTDTVLDAGVYTADELNALTSNGGIFTGSGTITVSNDSSVLRLRVVLLGGQSNADGRALVSELPTSPVNLQNPQNDVDLYYKTEGKAAALTTLRPGLSETSQFGPEILLGRRLVDLHKSESGTRVAIIKYANGGTNLDAQWKAGGDATTTGDGPEYVTFQQTVTQGLAALAAAHPMATLDVQSMVWVQGESDAVSGRSNVYQANLTNFIADVRATFGASLPFVIARLSSKQTALNATYLNEIRAAQDAVAAADPRTTVFHTDSFGIKSDNLHFNGTGQQSIGSRSAEETAYYAWMIDIFSAADIDAGLAEPDADRDGDGQSNRAEFLGASDPLSSASTFRSELHLTGPGVGEISYATSSARYYKVQRFVSEAGIWETTLPALQGTGSTVTRVLDTTAARGIFRVCSQLP